MSSYDGQIAMSYWLFSITNFPQAKSSSNPPKMVGVTGRDEYSDTTYNIIKT